MNYESTFICSPDLVAEKVEELTGKVIEIIESSKGSVKSVQQLGKKRLAYPINKFREGSYVYMELSGEGEMVNAIENFFKLNDNVIRYLTVKVKKKKAMPVKSAPKKQKEEEPKEAEEAAVEVKDESATDDQSTLA